MYNYIVLVESKDHKREETTLYNFSQVDYTYIDGIAYIRVLCDNRFYFFKSIKTYIKRIKILNKPVKRGEEIED